MKVPVGTHWTPPVEASSGGHAEGNKGADVEEDIDDVPIDESGEVDGLEEFFSDAESMSGARKKKKKTKTQHVEDPHFTGDRVLANEILFLQDMGWWVIAAHAVPEGEIGRVWEIMKVLDAVFMRLYV
jgi:hypothetical protein